MKNPIPRLLNRFLCQLGIRIDFLRIQEIHSRHPLPHSIRSLSDALDELQVPNMVCRLEFGQLFEIEGPFVVVAGNDEYPFYLVEKVDKKNRTVSLCSAFRESVVLTFEQFRSAWDGTVLLAEKGDETAQEPLLAYRIKQGLAFVERTSGYWLAALSLLLIGACLLRAPELADLRYVVKAAGLAVSLAAVYKASFDPHLAQRFCRLGKHSDCNEVFRSAGAKLFGWISLGELSAVYFAASLLFGILFGREGNALFPALDAIALGTVVYSSVWQLRKGLWCTLCLAIDAILTVDFIGEVVVWNGFHPFDFGHLAAIWLLFGLLFAVGVIFIRRFVTMAEQNRELDRLKFRREQLLDTPRIFWRELAEQSEVETDSSEFRPLDNGVEAEHTIIVVMNPSCPKCARVHKMLASLAEWPIRLFFITNDGDERSRNAALRMISARFDRSWEDTERLIEVWYERYELLAQLILHPEAERILAAHKEFCRKAGITGTPTVLVDNRRLPAMYETEDLKILL